MTGMSGDTQKEPAKLNRAERRRQKRKQKAAKKLRMQNRQDANRVINKFSERWQQCKTDGERQAFIESLSPDERREISNAKAYMQLQTLFAYSQLPEETRAELKKGNVDVLSR